MKRPGGKFGVERIDDFRWRIPRRGAMRVDGLIFASAGLMDEIRGSGAVAQVANVASLPGIVGRSIGMPDIHWGYGFAIGGVAAFDPARGGVISPGGVGYDINCGVRLHRSDLAVGDVRPRIAALMDDLSRRIPAGIGRGHGTAALTLREVRDVLVRGAEWTVSRGHGWPEDLAVIEDGGRLPGADPGQVSVRAVERGRDQLGTVGSGNHFVEVGFVDEVYDGAAAGRLGLGEGTVTVLIHSGSRGLGYQVCDDYLALMLRATDRYGIDLPDRQLACAPVDSPEGRRYIGAMRAAANYAFASRQMMGHEVRRSFAGIFGTPARDLRMSLVYDVAHNNAKAERHRVGGEERELWVHRKGATRAFPPGHPQIPHTYRDLGQPVFIPGDMGRYSFVLLGTEGAFAETFGSTCHGAGRRKSRRKAKRDARGRDLARDFRRRGVEVRASSMGTVAEELPEAYKDVADVVGVVDRAGIGRRVVRLRPLGVLKG